MTVEEIKRQKGHLYKITLSDNSSFLVDCDVCEAIPIVTGKELSKEEITDILKTSDYERAKSRALWFLDRGDRTEKSLYEKLVAAKISPEQCARAIARLKELGLIDDRRYAKNYAERCIESNISKRETYGKLMQKGVPKDIIREVLEETQVDEVSQITALIKKKYANKLDSRENTAKVVAALMRKGFSYPAVKEALRAYGEELEYIDGE
ncbi:MAG: regulatory protein RecX [Clostridia bacterium]|nr:regulatory protein RecX [Clostridia bacterium]